MGSQKVQCPLPTAVDEERYQVGAHVDRNRQRGLHLSLAGLSLLMMASPSKRDAGEAFDDAAPTSRSSKPPKRRRKQAKQSNKIKHVSERPTDGGTGLIVEEEVTRQLAQEDKQPAQQDESTTVPVQEQDRSAKAPPEAQAGEQRSGAREKHRKRQESRLSRKQQQSKKVPAKPDHSASGVRPRYTEEAYAATPGHGTSATTATQSLEVGTSPDQGRTHIVSSVPLEDRIAAPPPSKKQARHGHIQISIDQPRPKKVRVEAAGTDRKKKRKEKHKQEGRTKKDWALMEIGAGSFIDQDPLLTPDDQYLILATRSEVRVYARSTSLLVRTLRPDGKGHIVSCMLSPGDSTMLVVAKSQGRTSSWNWTEGSLQTSWKHTESTRCVLPYSTSDMQEKFLVLSDVEDAPDRPQSLSLVTLTKSTGLTSSDSILQRTVIDKGLQFFDDCGVLVGSAHKRLFIGHCPTFQRQKDHNKAFTWRDLTTPGLITSVSAHIVRKPGTASRGVPQIDVAVGLSRGEIIIYQDILRNLIGREKNAQSQQLITRGLHWHRGPVNTLKWSQDGNYIISGGNETVLVIWQLDTNQQQYLPHLTTEILNLTVSEKGSAYALRLADNSVMVLSTAELAPITNVSGLAIGQQRQQVAAVMHPASSEQLLIAVPRNCLHHTGPSFQSANQLQTWDYSADLQLHRQALTRNMITTVNIGPGGQSIREPHVAHLQISHDGQWLATIDEWYCDPNDKQGMWISGEDDHEHGQLEITLKFWSHNNKQGDWELNTRIDAPHGITYCEVLSLATNPQKAEFASAGIDNDITIWVPRARIRDGVDVKDQSGRQLYTWSKKRTIHASSPSPIGSQPSSAPSAAIAYSDDGSVLAATWPHHVSAVTYIIDCEAGLVSSRVPGLFTCSSRERRSALLAFSGRYLVVSSDKLLFYDTVDARTISEYEFQDVDVRHQPGSIAVSKIDGTVAVALNASNRLSPSRILTFKVNATVKEPVLDRKVPGPVRALLACAATPGYVLIDGHSHIHQIREPGQPGAPSALPPKAEYQVAKGLDGIFGATPQNRGAPNAGARPLELSTVQDSMPSSKLESVFKFQSSSETPSARDLFSRIAGLFASVALPSQLRT